MTLTHLSDELGVSQRTLRRAADLGLVRGRRISQRRFHITLGEEKYLRRHWAMLSALRRALRTEPNVRLAVLFGSAARGDLHERSDIDLLVALSRDSAGEIAGLAYRLGEATGRAVQPVRLPDAKRRPALLADAVTDGRVLVDRDGRWKELEQDAISMERRAAHAAATFDEALAAAQPLGEG